MSLSAPSLDMRHVFDATPRFAGRVFTFVCHAIRVGSAFPSVSYYSLWFVNLHNLNGYAVFTESYFQFQVDTFKTGTHQNYWVRWRDKPTSRLLNAVVMDRPEPNAARKKAVEPATIGSGGSHASGGQRETLPGSMYQLKVVMLFAIRALNKRESFSLATEVKLAEKFDDLVIKVQRKGKNGIVVTFLQAKHKIKETKKISIDGLLHEGNHDFSLQKYYISYCKIKNSKKFKGTLENFIICTNIGFDESIRGSFEDVQKDIDYLVPSKDLNYKQPRCTKLVIDKFPLFNELVVILQKNQDYCILAEKLAKNVSNRKTTIIVEKIFEMYSKWLLENVFYEKVEKKLNKFYVKFRDSFLHPKKK